MDIKIFKNEFDVVFAEALNSFVKGAKSRTDNPFILDSIDHILPLSVSGKRIRPYNVALAYSVYSGKSWKNITHLLVGIELIHMMALIHDDIMDNADTRHGVQTAHEYTKRNIDSTSSKIFIEHTSRSQAILVGDMVFGWAYKSISKEKLSDQSWDVVNELVEEVIVGQMMDIMTPLENTTTMNSVEKKMLLKTARYTFSRPLVLGALCAGKNMEDILWLQKFGDALGLMFQAQDDLLDITASISLLQKSTLGDIKNGVHTIVSVYVSDNVNDEQKKIWDGWFGKNNDLNPVEVNKFLNDIGAIEYVENYISVKRNTAVDSLDIADIYDEHKDNFRKIIEMLSHRKY